MENPHAHPMLQAMGRVVAAEMSQNVSIVLAMPHSKSYPQTIKMLREEQRRRSADNPLSFILIASTHVIFQHASLVPALHAMNTEISLFSTCVPYTHSPANSRRSSAMILTNLADGGMPPQIESAPIVQHVKNWPDVIRTSIKRFGSVLNDRKQIEPASISFSQMCGASSPAPCFPKGRHDPVHSRTVDPCAPELLRLFAMVALENIRVWNKLSVKQMAGMIAVMREVTTPQTPVFNSTATLADAIGAFVGVPGAAPTLSTIAPTEHDLGTLPAGTLIVVCPTRLNFAATIAFAKAHMEACFLVLTNADFVISGSNTHLARWSIIEFGGGTFGSACSKSEGLALFFGPGSTWPRPEESLCILDGSLTRGVVTTSREFEDLIRKTRCENGGRERLTHARIRSNFTH